MAGRYFAVGTRPVRHASETASAVAREIISLIAGRDRKGLWGGPDSLDELVTTCHAAMTLMAAGVPPQGEVLGRSLAYLANIDVNRSTTFYWRCGPLLNVDGYDAIIQHDVMHLWKYKGRSGGNPSYPAPFFLLKLIRFYEGNAPLNVSTQEVVEWILSEWDDDMCWYGRTSITSMGLALVVDLKEVPHAYISRATEFLLESFRSLPNGRRGFDENVIDDAFTVYNLFERWNVIHHLLPNRLWTLVAECAEDLLPKLTSMQTIPPPFGGSVESPHYARAVLVRATMAHQLAITEDFDSDLAVALTNSSIGRILSQIEGIGIMTPFWGKTEIRDDGYCFVLMPFSPPRRTEIYEDFIKAPLMEKLSIPCRRADDIYASRPIMEDIWASINRAKFVVADLSDRNPNVFYELGLAHVVGKAVILVVERSEDLPFDLKGVRTIVYGDSPKSWKNLANQIVEFARQLVGAEP